MALEIHPLRFELQILLSSLPWTPKQTYRASALEIETGDFAELVTLAKLTSR